MKKIFLRSSLALAMMVSGVFVGSPAYGQAACSGFGNPGHCGQQNHCQRVGNGNNGSCQNKVPAAICGNGIVQTGEQCDDGNTVTETCAYGDTSCTVCNSTCQSVAGATSYCGDDVTNGAETCDDGAGNTNVAPTPGYGQTTPYCSTTCTAQIAVGPYCGDGVENGEEVCDGGANCAACACADGYIPDSESNGCVLPPSCGVDFDQSFYRPATPTALCANGQSINFVYAVGTGWTWGCEVSNVVIECDAYELFCGDGVENGGEQCDSGGVLIDECADGQTSCEVCSATCTDVTLLTYCQTPPGNPGNAHEVYIPSTETPGPHMTPGLCEEGEGGNGGSQCSVFTNSNACNNQQAADCYWNGNACVPVVVCTSSEEVCDGIDNDCDEAVDENLDCVIEEPVCGNGIVDEDEQCDYAQDMLMSESTITKSCSMTCTRVCTEEVVTDKVTITDHNVQATNNTPTISQTVSTGDTLQITAVGTWRAGESDSPASREGTADGLDGHPEFNGFKFGALVGRINGGAWFFVGTNFNQTVSESGLLELIYWDSVYDDNSGEVAVTVTTTTPNGNVENVPVECPVDDDDDDDDEDECTSEDCDDDDDETPTEKKSGGQASSVGGSTPATPATLLETGPENEGNVPTEATAETVIAACEEDTYILDRLGKLKKLSMEIVEVIPSKYARKIGTKAIKMTNQLSAMLRKTSDKEIRNDHIRSLVCKIEMMKEARGLRHKNIGAKSNGSEVDYLLQYLQDLAILQFVK